MSAFLNYDFCELARQEFVRNQIEVRELTNEKQMPGWTNVKEMVKNHWHLRYVDPGELKMEVEMLVYNDVEPMEKIRIYDKRVETPPHYDTFAEFHFSYHYGDVHCPYIKQNEPLRVECQHFVDCIREGTTPLSDGKKGLEVVQVLEAASQSLRLGGGIVYLNGFTPVFTAAPETQTARV